MMSTRRQTKQEQKGEYDYSDYDESAMESLRPPQPEPKMVQRRKHKRIADFKLIQQETPKDVPRPPSRGSSTGHSSRGSTPPKSSQMGVTATPRPTSRGSTGSTHSFKSYTTNRGRPSRDEVEQDLFPEEEETILDGTLSKHTIYMVLDRFTTMQLTQMCINTHVVPPSQKKNEVLKTAVYLVRTKDELIDFILSIFLKQA